MMPNNELNLVDIRSVTVDSSLSAAARIADFSAQIMDPYTYRCGHITVHACYASGPTLAERLTQLLA